MRWSGEQIQGQRYLVTLPTLRVELLVDGESCTWTMNTFSNTYIDTIWYNIRYIIQEESQASMKIGRLRKTLDTNLTDGWTLLKTTTLTNIWNLGNSFLKFWFLSQSTFDFVIHPLLNAWSRLCLTIWVSVTVWLSVWQPSVHAKSILRQGPNLQRVWLQPSTQFR